MPKAIKKVRRRSAARNTPKGDLPKIPVLRLQSIGPVTPWPNPMPLYILTPAKARRAK